MQLDASQLRRAAQQLGTALQHVDAADAVDVPMLFGRSAALRTQATNLDAAATNVTDARTAVAVIDGPLRDARDAIDELARHIDQARTTRTHLRSLAFDTARDAAERVQGELAHAADLAATPTDELLGAMIAHHADPAATDHAWRAIATVARARPDELGSAAPYLAELGSSAPRQAMADAVLTEQANLRTAWSSMLDAMRVGTVRAGNLQRAFAEITDGSTAAASAPPAWLRAFAPDELVRLTDDQAAELRLLGLAPNRDAVIDTMLATLRRDRLDKDDVRLLRAASELPEHQRVDVPLAPGVPSLDAMIGVETSGLHLAHVAHLHDAYVRLATSSDAVLDREVARLGSGPVTHHAARMLARLGVERADVVLGPNAATTPWAAQLLADTLDPHANWTHVAAARDAIMLVRRTDGDPARILAEVERLATAPSLREAGAELRQVGHALRTLPDAARPTGTAPLQPLLDEVFHGRDVLAAPNGASEHVHRRLQDGLAMLVDGARLANDPATTRASVLRELDELLARPLGELDDATFRRIAVFSTLPEHLRPRTDEQFAPLAHLTGNAYRNPRGVADWMRLLREGERIAAEPGTSRATTAAELRRIIELPREQLTRGDVRRVLALAHVPGDAAPIVGTAPDLARGGLQRVAGVGDAHVDATEWAGLSQVAREELDQLLLSAERAEVQVAGATPASVRAELRTILATTPRELTPESLRRIAVLDGLPSELRGYDAPSPGGDSGGIAGSWRAGQSGSSHDVDVAVRMLDAAVEAGELAASGHVHAEQLGSELARLLTRANDQLTPEQQRRIAVIASMPLEVRPQLPVPRDGMTIAEVAARDLWRAGLGRSALDAARDAILPNSDLSVDELVALARQADGRIRLDGIAPSARPRLTGAPAAELERLGLSEQSLLRDILEATSDSGDKRRVNQAVRDAHPIAARLQVDTPGEQQVLDRLRATLQRNLERASGRRFDGYQDHPDYAEHGRSIADAVLLGRIDDLRRSRVAEAAAAPTELLTW